MSNTPGRACACWGIETGREDLCRGDPCDRPVIFARFPSSAIPPRPSFPCLRRGLFLDRPRKRPKKKGACLRGAGAAFPRIAPVVAAGVPVCRAGHLLARNAQASGTGRSALRTFWAFLGAGAGGICAEKPLQPRSEYPFSQRFFRSCLRFPRKTWERGRLARVLG